METEIVEYINTILPVVIAVISAIGSIVTCIRSCKVMAAKHDEGLKQEVKSLREENKALRSQNRSVAIEMQEVVEKIKELEQREPKKVVYEFPKNKNRS